MQLYLAIDGGGSGTRARLVDAAGKLLGGGSGGPSNLRLGAAVAWDAVLTASRGAIAAAGLADDALTHCNAGLGLAGACIDPARDAFLARPSPFARLVLQTDAQIACLGAHAGAPGAIVIAGTGSVAQVWDGVNGRQIGGWGFPISDAGSGAWIGLEAVRHAVASMDSPTPVSPLATAILQRIGGSAEAAVLWADRAGPADYAALAPLVFAVAAGDAVASAILRAAAAHIDALVAAAERFGATKISLLGGLADLLKPLLASRARLVAPQGDALDGALRLIRARVP